VTSLRKQVLSAAEWDVVYRVGQLAATVLTAQVNRTACRGEDGDMLHIPEDFTQEQIDQAVDTARRLLLAVIVQGADEAF